MAKGEVRYRVTADTKPFEDAVRGASKEFEKFGETIAKGFGIGAGFSVGEKAADALVESIKGVSEAVVNAVEHVTEYAHTIEIAAAKTSLSTDTIQKLSVAARLTGTDLGAMTGLVGKLEKAIGSGNDIFRQLGINLADLKKSSPDEALRIVIDRLAAMKNPFEQAKAGAAVFGKAWQEMAAIMKNPEALDAADRLGAILGEKDVQASAKLAEAGKELSIVWEAVQNQFAAAIASNPALLDAIRQITERLGDLTQWSKDHREEISQATTSVVNWAEKYVDKIGKIGASLIAFTNSPAYKILQMLYYPTQQFLRFSTGQMAFQAAGEVGDYFASDTGSNAGAPKMLSPTQWRAANLGIGLPTISGNAPVILGPSAADQKIQDHINTLLLDSRIRAMNAFRKMVDEDHKHQMEEGHRFLAEEAKLDAEDLAARVAAGQQKLADEKQFMASRQKQVELEIQTHINNVKMIGSALSGLGQQLGGVGGGVISGAGGIVQGLAAHQQQAFENLKLYGQNLDGTARVTMTATEKFVALAQGIGAVTAAFQNGVASANKWTGALSGAEAGAAAGAAFGAPGAIVGGILGGLAGFLGGSKGAAQQLQALQAQYAALQQQARAAGIVMQQAFDPRNAQQLAIAIANLKLELDITAQASQALDKAMQTYGITIDQLGPKFRQQKLDEQFGQLYQDLQILSAAGVSNADIFASKWGDAFKSYIADAIRTGATVPEALRPIIEWAIQNGLLLDANGVAFTSVEQSGIHFAESVTAAVQSLIEKITDLVNALLGIPDIHRKIIIDNPGDLPNTNPDPNNPNSNPGTGQSWHWTGGGRPQGHPPGPGWDWYGQGGDFVTSGPRLIGIGEKGPERVTITPLSRAGALAPAAAMMGSAEILSELRSLNDNLRASMRAQPKIMRDAFLFGGVR